MCSTIEGKIVLVRLEYLLFGGLCPISMENREPSFCVFAFLWDAIKLFDVLLWGTLFTYTHRYTDALCAPHRNATRDDSVFACDERCGAVSDVV